MTLLAYPCLMTVGNARSAAMALSRFHGEGDCVKGYLSEGSTRAAFLIGGVVYKVPVNNDYDDWANKSEWTNYLRLSKRKTIPSFIRLPEYSRYKVNGTVILASTFIRGKEVGVCYFHDPQIEYLSVVEPCPGEDECIGTEMAQEFYKLDITDILLWNIIRKGDVLYPIDLA